MILPSSDKIKEISDLGIQVISHLAFVAFIRNLPLGKWEGFHDEFQISGFDSICTELVTLWLRCKSFMFRWVRSVKEVV